MSLCLAKARAKSTGLILYKFENNLYVELEYMHEKLFVIFFN